MSPPLPMLMEACKHPPENNSTRRRPSIATRTRTHTHRNTATPAHTSVHPHTRTLGKRAPVHAPAAGHAPRCVPAVRVVHELGWQLHDGVVVLVRVDVGRLGQAGGARVPAAPVPGRAPAPHPRERVGGEGQEEGQGPGGQGLLGNQHTQPGVGEQEAGQQEAHHPCQHGHQGAHSVRQQGRHQVPAARDMRERKRHHGVRDTHSSSSMPTTPHPPSSTCGTHALYASTRPHTAAPRRTPSLTQ
jgi:hypothetical protein